MLAEPACVAQRVPSMFDSLRGVSPCSNLMEVKESAAQGRGLKEA